MGMAFPEAESYEKLLMLMSWAIHLPTYTVKNSLRQASLIHFTDDRLRHTVVEQKPRFLQVVNCTEEVSR